MGYKCSALYTDKPLSDVRYVGPIRIEPRPDGGHDLVSPGGSRYTLGPGFDDMAVTDMALFLLGSAAAMRTEHGK